MLTKAIVRLHKGTTTNKVVQELKRKCDDNIRLVSKESKRVVIDKGYRKEQVTLYEIRLEASRKIPLYMIVNCNSVICAESHVELVCNIDGSKMQERQLVSRVKELIGKEHVREPRIRRIDGDKSLIIGISEGVSIKDDVINDIKKKLTSSDAGISRVVINIDMQYK